MRRFLYWPESMSIDGHAYVVEAVDAAGNPSGPIESTFTVAARKDFALKLIAGWNAVSVPANPIDPTIGSVFTEDVVDMVAAWDASDPEKPWSIATRMEGEWSTHDEFATLTRDHCSLRLLGTCARLCDATRCVGRQVEPRVGRLGAGRPS